MELSYFVLPLLFLQVLRVMNSRYFAQLSHEAKELLCTFQSRFNQSYDSTPLELSILFPKRFGYCDQSILKKTASAIRLLIKTFEIVVLGTLISVGQITRISYNFLFPTPDTSLGLQIRRLKAINEELTAELDCAAATIRSLQNTITTQNEDIAKRDTDLKLQDTIIASLQEQLAAKSATPVRHAPRGVTAEQRDEVVLAMRSMERALDDEIAKHKRTVDKYEEELEYRDSLLERKDRHSQECEQRLKESYKEEIAEKELELENVKMIAHERIAEIEQIKSLERKDLEMKEALQKKDQELKEALKKELEEVKSSSEALTITYKREVDERDTRLREKDASIQEQDKMLKNIEGRLNEVTAALEAALQQEVHGQAAAYASFDALQGFERTGYQAPNNDDAFLDLDGTELQDPDTIFGLDGYVVQEHNGVLDFEGNQFGDAVDAMEGCIEYDQAGLDEMLDFDLEIL